MTVQLLILPDQVRLTDENRSGGSNITGPTQDRRGHNAMKEQQQINETDAKKRDIKKNQKQ